MISPQFVDYIKRQLAAGIPREDIKKVLAINGLSEQDIAEGFAMVEGPAVADSVPPAAAPPTTPPAVAALAADIAPMTTAPSMTAPPTPPQTERPTSVKYFEFLMYASILVGAFITAVQFAALFSQSAAVIVWLAYVMPGFSLVAKLFLVWLAGERRKDWARWALLVFVALDVLGYVPTLFFVPSLLANPESFEYFGINTWQVLGVTGIKMVFEIAAMCFAFSSKANAWYSSSRSSSSPGTIPQPGDGKIWKSVILGINIVSLIGYVGLLVGIDYPIAIASPGLIGFGYIMLGVFALYIVFFILETFPFRYKFGTTRSKSDSGIIVIIGLRNIIFLLNFIPFIQLLGLAALPTVGSILLVIYIILIVRRFHGLHR